MPHCVCVQNVKLVQNVKALADRKGCTPGQLAIAWVQHQGDDVISIPGTKRVKYLEQNVAAADIKLTKQELQELEEAVPQHEVQFPVSLIQRGTNGCLHMQACHVTLLRTPNWGCEHCKSLSCLIMRTCRAFMLHEVSMHVVRF